MKYLKIPATIICSVCLLFFFSCSNSSDNKTSTADTNTNSSDVKTGSANENLSGSQGSFSYTINGEKVETINYVQHSNLFINEVSNDVANGMVKIEVTCLGSNVFDFEIANSGSTSIKNYSPSLSGFTDKKTKAASYMDGKTLRNLYAVSVTVNITTITDSRITGTFSGTFKAEESDGGATAEVTNGSFNLPFIKN